MTGKKEVERKVLGKEHQSLSPKKLDLKKEKEEVKFMGGLVAEITAVQAELTRDLLNPEGRLITGQRLRQVNLAGAHLNKMVDDYLLGLLNALDQDDQDKPHLTGMSGQSATM